MKAFSAALCAAVLSAPLAQAAIVDVVVRPSNPQGWAIANQRADAQVAITTAQPRTGQGSLQFDVVFVTPGQDKVDFEYAWNPLDYPTRLLANLTALEFEYYRDSNSAVAAHLHPALRLGWYNDGGTPTDTSDDTQGRLIYEDIYQGIASAPVDQWVTRIIDPASTRLWMYCNWCVGGTTGTVQNFSLTLNDWLSGPQSGQPGDPVPPDLSQGTTYVWAVNVGVGSGWGADLRMHVDNVRLAFGPNDDQRFNFEPDPAAPPQAIPALSIFSRLGLLGSILALGWWFMRRRAHRLPESPF